MILVEVPNCEYDLFSRYRDKLWNSTDKCGVVSAEYSKDLKIARFWFLDSFYVPEYLKRYIIKPLQF